MLCAKATLWTINQSFEGLYFVPKPLEIRIQLRLSN